MADEIRPKLEVVHPTPEELDEEEKEFRALRRDLPGVKGAAAVGMLTISVGRQPTPKNEFYRTHQDFRPIMPLVNVEAGMDRHYIAVTPSMIEPLAGIGITVTDHILYLTVTPRGGLRIIPIRWPQRGRRDERIGPHERDGADRRHRRLGPDVLRPGEQRLQELSRRRRAGSASRTGRRSSPRSCFAWRSATRAA